MENRWGVDMKRSTATIGRPKGAVLQIASFSGKPSARQRDMDSANTYFSETSFDMQSLVSTL